METGRYSRKRKRKEGRNTQRLGLVVYEVQRLRLTVKDKTLNVHDLVHTSARSLIAVVRGIWLQLSACPMQGQSGFYLRVSRPHTQVCFPIKDLIFKLSQERSNLYVTSMLHLQFKLIVWILQSIVNYQCTDPWAFQSYSIRFVRPFFTLSSHGSRP